MNTVCAVSACPTRGVFRPGALARAVIAGAVMLASGSVVMAQTTPPTTPPQTATTYFQIFNGQVSNAASVSVQSGDQVVAVVGGQTFSTAVSGSGQYQNLTLTRTVNDSATITFELRRGTQRWALVRTSGATEQISVPFSGSSNPLGAAFAAQTINAFVGPSLTGGGGGGGGGGGTGTPATDPLDVDGDGQITSNDALLVMRFVTGDRAGVRNPKVFDTNGDGVINTDDIVAVLRRVGTAAVAPATTGPTANPSQSGTGTSVGAGSGTSPIPLPTR